MIADIKGDDLIGVSFADHFTKFEEVLQNSRNFTEYDAFRPYHSNILGFALMKTRYKIHKL